LTGLMPCLSLDAMKRKQNKRSKIDPALEHALSVAGGPAEVARTLGITVQAVCEWKRCPSLRAIELEKATGGVVTRQRLRPDLYPFEA
jgi:DNA-binding transcriptional regulator YdaS (Cro superfamily)